MTVTMTMTMQEKQDTNSVLKYDAIHTVTELWWAHAHLEVLYAVRELGLPHPGFQFSFNLCSNDD